MENKNDMGKNSDEPQKKSWLERNLWWVALFLALFLVRMCNQLS